MFSQKFTRQLSSGELMREITKHNYEGGEGGVEERGEGASRAAKGSSGSHWVFVSHLPRHDNKHQTLSIFSL